MLDGLLGAADQLDRREIRVLDSGAPADGSVLLEQERLGLRMALEGLRDLARNQEARAPVVQRNDISAIDLPQHFSRAIVDRKSTRLNSSHQIISYAVFCLK